MLWSIARYETCPTSVVYAIGVGFIEKWALSPNRLVFWVNSPVCPITMILEPDSEWVAVGGLEELAVTQRNRDPMQP